jgi:hypothetical protein
MNKRSRTVVSVLILFYHLKASVDLEKNLSVNRKYVKENIRFFRI